jgi:hypothetical protein
MPTMLGMHRVICPPKPRGLTPHNTQGGAPPLPCPTFVAHTGYAGVAIAAEEIDSIWDL